MDTHTQTWSSGHTHTHLEQWKHTHWSSGHTHNLEQQTHTHTHTHIHWSSGHTHTHTHTHLEQWKHTPEQWAHTHTHTHTHTPGAVGTHTHTHTHTWSSGNTPHTHTPGAVETHTHTTHLEQWAHTHTHTPGAVETHTPHTHTHTWSSGQSTLRRPGGSWGFGALLKGLTSVVDNSCRSREPQPQITSPTLYPLGHDCTSIITYSYTVLLHIQCGSVKSNAILIKIHKHIKSYSIASEIPSNVRFFSEI